MIIFVLGLPTPLLSSLSLISFFSSLLHSFSLSSFFASPFQFLTFLVFSVDPFFLQLLLEFKLSAEPILSLPFLIIPLYFISFFSFCVVQFPKTLVIIL